MGKKEIPRFKNEEEERVFWLNHDSTDYIDWSLAKEASFPNLKPSTETISLRLPKDLLDRIKTIANKMDVPYQSFMKMLLAEKISDEKYSYSTERQNKLTFSVREPTAKYSVSAAELTPEIKKSQHKQVKAKIKISRKNQKSKLKSNE